MKGWRERERERESRQYKAFRAFNNYDDHANQLCKKVNNITRF